MRVLQKRPKNCGTSVTVPFPQRKKRSGQRGRKGKKTVKTKPGKRDKTALEPQTVKEETLAKVRTKNQDLSYRQRNQGKKNQTAVLT